MELSSLTSQSLMAGRAAETGMAYFMLAAKRTLDVMQTQGELMVQLIDQAAGLGRNVDATA